MGVGGFRNPIIVSGGLGGINYDVDIFTSPSGTWTKPSNLDYVYALIVGGGGGGSGGARNNPGTNRAGGLSANGVVALVKIPAENLSSTESVTVGIGGEGGPGRTVNGSSIAGFGGGSSIFKEITIPGGSSTSTSSVGFTRATTGYGIGTLSNSNNARKYYVTLWYCPYIIGTIIPSSGDAAQNIYRGNSIASSITTSPSIVLISSPSAGGGISSAEIIYNGGGLFGIVNPNTGVIEQETTGATVGVNGAVRTPTISFGTFLNAKFFPWLDPLDIPQMIGLPGGGGGPGDLAGTIGGGNGGNGSGYGAAGGGGGAATAGSNGGNGGNGSNGLVVIINVYNS